MAWDHKTESGWHVIHDFMYGWGLQEPTGVKRIIYIRELPEYLRGNAKYMTAKGLEQVWPAIQAKRQREAARIAAMPKPEFKKFTIPNIKAPYPDIDIRDVLSSVQPMTSTDT